MAPHQLTKARIGQLLLEKKLLTIEQLNEALKQQELTGRPLGEILIAYGFVQEKEVLELLSQQMQVPYFDLTNFTPTQDALSLVPSEHCRQYLAIPVFKTGSVLTVAMSDPLDLDTLARLRHVAGCDINPVLSSSRAVTQAIEKFYVRASGAPSPSAANPVVPAGTSTQPKSVLTNTAQQTVPPKPSPPSAPSQNPSFPLNPDISTSSEMLLRSGARPDRDADRTLTDTAKEAPIIRKVNSIIEQAVKEGASDIHFEPTEKQLSIRYRIDGVLHKLSPIAKEQQDAVVSRVKIMSEIDIAERRLPQDGRVQINVAGKDVDIRISTFPTIYGESVVMRLLIKSVKPPALTELGFSDYVLKNLEGLLKKSHGMVLVTGPTGSGKTTTLYAALNKVNTTDRNILTLEDPVEYRLEGVRQSQIAPKAGLTFAQGLRAVVRQDPDVIMVGEIRDSETAQIAIHAALTGHLVFSTLHTNDAPGAVARLIDMGAEPFLVSSSVIGVVAQRLIRLICENCREPLKITPVLSHGLKLPAGENATFYHGKGCKMCKMTGYRGRTVIAEIMIPTPEISQLIIQKAPSEQIKAAMAKSGIPSLIDDGLRRVLAGQTSLEEVLRQAS